MKSFAYRGIRISSQIISITLMLLNAFGIMYFFSKQGSFSNRVSEAKPLLSFQDTSQYVCAINILFGLLASCTITSGIKLYMRAYSRLAYMQIGYSLLSAVYFYCLYRSILPRPVAITTPTSSKYIEIPNGMELASVENSYYLALREELIFATKVFCILQVITSILNYLLIKLFGLATSIKLETTHLHPKIVQTHAGLSNEILKERQVVTLESVAGQ